MLTMSNLYNQLVQYSRKANGQALCIYGDPAYPLRPQLQGPFNYSSFLYYKKNFKIELSAVGKMYCVCALLTNAHTCLYRSMTSDFFDIEPPIFEEYFI